MGVKVNAEHLASASFADDLTLIATSFSEVIVLVTAYHLWCTLLGIKLHPDKTQVWTNVGSSTQEVTLPFGADSVTLTCRPTFRVVGIELGADARLATTAHFAPRLRKALVTGRRLAALPIPAALTSTMYRCTVLAQGMYGCEIRNVTSANVLPLLVQGKQMLAAKHPLQLAHYCASEVITGPPTGACSLPFIEHWQPWVEPPGWSLRRL